MFKAVFASQIAALAARHAMTAAGAWVMQEGIADAQTVEAISGGAVALVGLFWSVKEKAARR